MLDQFWICSDSALWGWGGGIKWGVGPDDTSWGANMHTVHIPMSMMSMEHLCYVHLVRTVTYFKFASSVQNFNSWRSVPLWWPKVLCQAAFGNWGKRRAWVSLELKGLGLPVESLWWFHLKNTSQTRMKRMRTSKSKTWLFASKRIHTTSRINACITQVAQAEFRVTRGSSVPRLSSQWTTMDHDWR